MCQNLASHWPFKVAGVCQVRGGGVQGGVKDGKGLFMRPSATCFTRLLPYFPYSPRERGPPLYILIMLCITLKHSVTLCLSLSVSLALSISVYTPSLSACLSVSFPLWFCFSLSLPLHCLSSPFSLFLFFFLSFFLYYPFLHTQVECREKIGDLWAFSSVHWAEELVPFYPCVHVASWNDCNSNLISVCKFVFLTVLQKDNLLPFKGSLREINFTLSLIASHAIY